MSAIVGGRPPTVPPPSAQVSVPSVPSTASLLPTAVASSPTPVSSGPIEPLPVALPTGTGPFVAANHTYGQTVRRDSIAARLEDGEPTGEWWRSTTRGGQTVQYSGPVTCLVIAGDDAWLAGRATTATDGRPDLAIFFHVHDGGPAGESDTAIGYLSNPGQTLATMEGWCRTKFIPAGPYPLTSGDLVVDDGSP
jgi:hypothetical protein